ncbi:flagellin [Rhizobium sp. BK538]|uniref:flagellin N-terminal helical domain-containing protein n=1 Tax=Rhizobium sp. BK538 TaxID=2586984 RepID=UPI001611DC28|nr:flagellin [Rhizobium sp. BK538]MBB4170441.1 flagellin [Rhizobium sp. BK538]
MTSILTNGSASIALQALRKINSDMQGTQRRVSSGLRIDGASDNAAYWAIATTMRSDLKAVSAVSDALGTGAAKVDTAYAGMTAVTDVLAEFKAKLVTATEAGVDKTKVQADLDQLKQTVWGIAHSASFNGENWLSSNIEDINDSDLDVETVVSAFVRDASGNVSVKTTTAHLAEIALFNSTGGGLLEADTRKLKTLGGIRDFDTFMDNDGEIWMSEVNSSLGTSAAIEYTFSGPLTFGASDNISFNVTVDKDNSAEVPPPHNTGATYPPVEITRATVDAYNPALNGKISTFQQYIAVLNIALDASGAQATARTVPKWDAAMKTWIADPDKIAIWTDETSGLDGSYVEISNFSSTVGSGGIGNASAFGTRGSELPITFVPFEVYKDGDNLDGVEVFFSFNVNGQAPTSSSFNRAYVNNLLGKDTGKVETPTEMVTLLKSLVSADWPDVIIEETGGNGISIRSDNNVDRLSGTKSYIGFTNISVSIEPISDLDFMEIDIVANPQMLDVYLSYTDLVFSDVVSAASVLGSLQKRIDIQAAFAHGLAANLNTGVGRLVDADMEEESSRLAALQTQQQLALQSLSIGNGSPKSVLQLFQ